MGGEGRVSGLWGFALGLGAFVSLSLQAIVVPITDIDDTLFETRQERQGTFVTHYKLFKMQLRHGNVLHEIPEEEPNEVLLTPMEYERERQHLAAGPELPGRIGRRARLSSGITIHPGFYFVRNPDTYQYYGSAPEGAGRANYILDQFREAETRAPQWNWRGPFFPFWQLYLSNEETARYAAYLTARLVSRPDLDALHHYQRERGYIRHVPPLQHFFGIYEARLDPLELEAETVGRKVAVLREIIRELARVPLDPVRDDKLSPNGDVRGQYHTLVFAEDREDIVNAVAELFTSMAASQRWPVKLILVNAGKKTSVRDSQRDMFAVATARGTWRPATPEEIIGEVKTPSPEQAAFLATMEGASRMPCLEKVIFPNSLMPGVL